VPLSTTLLQHLSATPRCCPQLHQTFGHHTHVFVFQQKPTLMATRKQGQELEVPLHSRTQEGLPKPRGGATLRGTGWERPCEVSALTSFY
jgi:hypothetical protein